MEFHRSIAAITGNPILELIVDFVETVMVDLKKEDQTRRILLSVRAQGP